MDLFGEQRWEQQGEDGGRWADTAWGVGAIAFVHAQIEQEVGYPDEQVLAGKKGTSIAAKANSQLLSRKDTVLKLVPHRKAHAQRLERVKLLS